MKLLKRILIFSIFVAGIAVFIWGTEEFKVPARLALQREAGRQNAELKAGEEKTKNEVQPIKFAVFSDIHSDLVNLKKALDLAKNEEAEFVIITGDLTTVGKKSELLDIKKILDQSRVEYYVIPGNHDNWTGNQLKKDYFQEIFGQRYQSFYKGSEVKFILVDNGGYGGLNVTEENWLKKEAAECPKIYCLVFMHMPLNHTNSLHIMGEDNSKVATQAGELVKLLAKDKIGQIFAGHLHFSSDYKIGSLSTAIVGSLATERNFQSPKFLEVTYRSANLNKQDVFLPN